jgi:hypothetical protein
MGMQRRDLTSSDYLKSYQCPHYMSEDEWLESPVPVGAIDYGMIYVKCSCGWRLVDILNTDEQFDKAVRRFQRHAKSADT